jgi:hypothetical protein
VHEISAVETLRRAIRAASNIPQVQRRSFLHNLL